MATRALGPTFAGGMQPIVTSGYELLYYPDVNNHQLQREGKSPVFYWLPNYVHIARKNGNEDGDLMFNMIRFAGRQTAESTIGAEETREVAGGVLSFTTNSAPPDEVLIESQAEIRRLFEGADDYFWGIRNRREPVFRPVPIVSNITSISNLSPLADGSVPAVANDGPAGDGGGNPPTRSSVQQLVARSRSASNYDRRSVPFQELGEVKTRSNIDPWHWQMQGTGAGSIDPMGQNAYTALVGAYPTALLWESFQGSYSPVFAQQALKVKFWTPVMTIKISGSWQKVYEHFSAHLNARYLWASADIKAEFNNMRTSGTIEVEIKVDETLPNADRLAEYIDKRTELVFQKFMEQAKTTIFDVPTPEVEAAHSNGGGSWWGGVGLALKYRRDKLSLNLDYKENRQIAYLQDTVISSSLEGLHDIIAADPAAKGKYFQTIYMGDWPRKLGRIIKPIGIKNEAVAFMSAQIGYPNTQGELMWVGRPFQKSDPDDHSWTIGITQKFEADVDNPPAGWSADTTFIKRAIHMNEPPTAYEDPHRRIQIEDNIIYIDGEEKGSPVNDITLEVRADQASKLALGPITIGAELENSRQVIEVTFQPTDADENVLEQYEAVKFSWNYDDQDVDRFWAIYTSNTEVGPYYRYKVRVVVKGSIFSRGMEWEGPWRFGLGNGPIMVSIPTPEDEGVVQTRHFPDNGSQPTDGGGGGSSTPPPTDGSSPPTGDQGSTPPGNTPPTDTSNPAPASEELEITTYGLEDDTEEVPPSNRNVPPPASTPRTAGDDDMEKIEYHY